MLSLILEVYPLFWSTVSLHKSSHVLNFLPLEKYSGVSAFVCCARLSSFPHYTLFLKGDDLSGRMVPTLTFCIFVSTCSQWFRGSQKGYVRVSSIGFPNSFFHKGKHSGHLLIFVDIFSVFQHHYRFLPIFIFCNLFLKWVWEGGMLTLLIM